MSAKNPVDKVRKARDMVVDIPAGSQTSIEAVQSGAVPAGEPGPLFEPGVSGPEPGAPGPDRVSRTGKKMGRPLMADGKRTHKLAAHFSDGEFALLERAFALYGRERGHVPNMTIFMRETFLAWASAYLREKGGQE
ncbi:MAG: hypothetical protein LBT40_12090 [Deltaproteobacteria bacterium]|jgi:hypothetical protein|nr:hypothetical protein [Deltaproteobacteria bacterium]